MSHVVAIHYCQCGGRADAVVGTEGSAVGGQPVAIDDEANRVGVEVVRRAFIFLADHVEVALQDGGHSGLAARRRRFAHDDVAYRVADRLQSQSCGLREYILARRLFVARRAGDRGEGFKMPPQRRGLKVIQYFGHEGLSYCVAKN